MKKTITFLIAFLYTLVVWGERVEIDGLFYSINSDTQTASVSYHLNKGYTGDIVIPSYVVYEGVQYTVTGISAWAFKGNQGITSVSIPNTIVENIDNYAFENCQSLKSVYWNACNYNGDSPFYAIKSNITSFTFGPDIKAVGSVCSGMTNLTTVIIPDGVTAIGKNAFSYCGFKSITLPNSVRTIGNNAFESCDSLVSITLSDNLTEIQENAFAYCTKLASIDLPRSLTTIGALAFCYCKSLTSVTIPVNVTHAGADGFKACSNLTSVTWNARNCQIEANGIFTDQHSNVNKYITSFTIGDSVQVIPDILCNRMEKLTSIKVPQNVKTIGYSAFGHCIALESVEIGAGVESIESNAFLGCEKIKKVNYLGTPSQWANIKFGGYQASPIYYAKSLNINNKRLTEIQIAHIDSVRQYAFCYCRNLKSVKIGKGVKNIGLRSFMYCDSLSVLSLCNGLKKIDEGAFDGCKKIPEVVIPHTVTEISTDAFAYCENLRNVTIGSGVETVGERAFYGANVRNIVAYPPKLLEIPYMSLYYGISNKNLYVPCQLIEQYQAHETYKRFKSIQCIAADNIDAVNTVGVEVFENQTAQLSWYAIDGAATYQWDIYANDVLFSTLLFNAEGKLQTATFANRSVQPGFQFTIYGLEAATQYDYNLVALDENANTLQTYKGFFVTKSDEESPEDDPTSVEENLADAKIIISEGLIQVADANIRIYNMIGLDVTRNNGNLMPGIYLVSVNGKIAKVRVK